MQKNVHDKQYEVYPLFFTYCVMYSPTKINTLNIYTGMYNTHLKCKSAIYFRITFPVLGNTAQIQASFAKH